MRILQLSKDGDGLGIANRLALEGHSIDLYIKNERYARCGKGLVNRVSGWQQAARKADLIICDMVGFGRFEEMLQQTNKPYLACNRFVEQLELKREKGMELFTRAGISVPETFAFASVSEAKSLPTEQEWGLGFVIKPEGNAGESLTMIVREPENWDYCISKVPKDARLVVQRIVEGIEVSTEGWFNGRDFIKPFNHTFEEKRLLVGNLGPNTGCMGNVVFAHESNKLTRATVERLGPFLKMVGYRGPIDINCIVSEKHAYALESTSRFGYDAIEALSEGLQEPLSDLLFETAVGTKKEMAVTRDAMMSVRLTIPPWPNTVPRPDAWGEPILGIDEKALDHLYLEDVYRDDDGVYRTAGAEGIICKATATGRKSTLPNGGGTDYVREASRRCYRLLDNISVGAKQYRTDIGRRVNANYATLKEQGWI